MKIIAPQRHLASAFTLIELLVVIVIIAILAGISFPVAGKVKEAALKASAKNDASQLAQAVGSYRMEYGKFPVNSNDDTVLRTTDSTFMAVLLATDLTLNPRGIVYFEGRPQANAGSGGLDLPGNYNDPWGTPYEVYIDGNFDNRITITGEQPMRKAVGVRSAGPDRTFGSQGESNRRPDDINSWE